MTEVTFVNVHVSDKGNMLMYMYMCILNTVEQNGTRFNGYYMYMYIVFVQYIHCTLLKVMGAWESH